MYDYRDYCPIAKSAALLCERWTLLIVREMLTGVAHFNALRRALPRISPSVLRDRLRTLEAHGVVMRRTAPDGRSVEYRLTQAGRDLEPVIMALGRWGLRWGDATLAPEDLNADVLMRDIERTLIVDALPSGRSILCFKFDDAPNRSWLLVVDEGRVELCDEDRAFDVDVYVVTSLMALTELWLGRVSHAQLLESNHLKLVGAAAYARTFAEWLGRSPLVS